MAKPGDLVEFTAGLHGLDPPRNVAILLDRYRKKGVPWVRLATLEGEKEVKAEHLKARRFRARHEGRLDDAAAVQARLRMLVAQHEKGGLVEESEDDLGRLEEALWHATCDHRAPDGSAREAWTEAEVAKAHYGPEPSATQLRDVREALDRCRRAGTGRFQTTAGRGDTWRPWSRAEADAMRRAWQDLAALRAKLVRTIEVGVDVGEDNEGRLGDRRFQRVPLQEAGLADADRATMAWVERAMRQFVEWDGVPDGDEPVAGIGGLGAVQVFGMDLHRQLGFLAQDWIGGEHTTTSSDYVQFLLESGLWGPQAAVEALMRRHVNQEEFFEHTPDARAESEADALPEPRLEDDPDRTDLRHLACYTIDPPDAKDFDDAVGIELVAPPSGPPDATPMQRLWVHVADVSHYVRLDSYLDRHARKRATSVYLPGRVLPMLPHRISDHLCSLRDDGDRFALSVGMDILPDGRVGATQFRKAIIRVTENLSYGTALERARAGEPAFVQLLELAARMRTHRQGLALETGELKVLLGATGFTALEKHADDATRMIEAFMVAANEAVARHLSDEGVPQLFRCHPLPDPTRAERFQHQLETMGLPAGIRLPRRMAAREPARFDSLLDQLKAGGGKLNLFGGGVQVGAKPGKQAKPTPQVAGGTPGDAAGAQAGPSATAPAPPRPIGFLQLPPEEREQWLAPFRAVVDMLADLRDQDLAEVATLKLLGCMGRAYYTPDNEGHFGLASTHYAHFTSPIRRYPDLVVHRNLKWRIAGGHGPLPHSAESLRAMCDHCSAQERAADGLERRIKASTLVLATLGKSATAQARITRLTPASVFVLRNDGIEARVPARELPGGPYDVDEWESMLYLDERTALERDHSGGAEAAELRTLLRALDRDTGEARRVRARLGDRVTVQLAGRDVAAGRTGARLVAWHGVAG